VVDELIGHRAGDAHVHWHFDPRGSVACESAHALAASHVDGVSAWLVHDGCAASLAYGDHDSGLGWCSPRYGAVVPTWSARLSRRPGGPPSLVTWIGAAGRDEARPSIERVPSEAQDDGPVIAVCLRRPCATSFTAIRPGPAAPLGVRQCAAGGYHSNARLLHYTLDVDGAPRSLAMADGTRALALDDAFVSLSADVAVRDVSLRIDQASLDLRASAPPPLLRLRGRALDRIVTVRLNGRGMPRVRRTPDGGMILSGDDWPEGAIAPGVDLCVA
jgi:hypothetical protein